MRSSGGGGGSGPIPEFRALEADATPSDTVYTPHGGSYFLQPDAAEKEKKKKKKKEEVAHIAFKKSRFNSNFHVFLVADERHNLPADAGSVFCCQNKHSKGRHAFI